MANSVENMTEDEENFVERVWRQLKLPDSEYDTLADYALRRMDIARSGGWDERFTTFLVKTIARDYSDSERRLRDE